MDNKLHNFMVILAETYTSGCEHGWKDVNKTLIQGVVESNQKDDACLAIFMREVGSRVEQNRISDIQTQILNQYLETRDERRSKTTAI